VTSRSFPLLRNAMYALRGGFLVRPLLISIALGLAGAVLSSLEETVPAVSAWVPSVLFPSHADPQVAQIVLATIAASIMTVVSIVFAILLMTLTPRVDAVLAADSVELRQGSRNPVDAGHFPRHLRLLHGRLARRALIAAPVCACRHGHLRDAAGSDVCGLADLLHPSHLRGDQRQSHRRSNRARDRGCDR
jgi:hypothetical protein